MIVSVHIHKNGGMQFKNFLIKSYGKKLFLEYGKDNEVLKRFFLGGGDNKKPDPKDYKNFDIIHGHFLANRFDHFSNIELITFLRDPAQRLISNYYFFKNNFYDHSPICHMIKDGLSLEDYINIESSKNVQSFFLANKSIKDFKFIGILEEYAISVFLLKKELNIKFSFQNTMCYYNKYLNYLRDENKSSVMTFNKMSANKNKNKIGHCYDISPKFIRTIKNNNKIDYELYNEAKLHFKILKEKHNV
ncbi:sulfotransferase family 2 domain-containing protein [Candidatus Acidulodesulfobacterium sp. H_13]|uniref:sulfotransferase family 2 domain-containing protein n=1 Tax=Candidatus Acidulodesulfobacterium sp. H_13 TaxID=3395470 RepID=UPI003AF5177E